MVEVSSNQGQIRRDELAKLARRVLTVCRRAAQSDPNQVLPGERELAEKLRVTRHAVRNALIQLDREGHIRRLPGRGAVLADAIVDHAAPPRQSLNLQCINFLIGPSMEPPSMQWLFRSYLAGYTEVLEPYAIKTRFLPWPDDRTDYESALWSQANWNDQACLVVNRRISGLLGWLNENQVPYVMQNHAAYDDRELPPHHKIYVNKAGGVFDATRHLLDLGHRRIGFIGPFPKPTALSAEHEGYMAAVRCAGLTPNPDDILDFVTQVPELAVEPARGILDRADRPTAIVTASGALALGVLEVAKSLRIEVPAELSVIGLSSDTTGEHTRLSTISVPRHELARTAIQMLLDHLRQKPSHVQTRILNCKLDLRETTAAPAMT